MDMKVEVAQASDVQRRMTVSIPSVEVDHEIEKAYQTLQKSVRLRGFRPGKAPIAMLQRYCKAQVEEDVVNKLVRDTYPKALDQLQVLPISQPKIENGALEHGQDFCYTAVFEIKPAIEVCGYEGLALEKKKGSVTAEEIAREIDSLRNSCAALKDVSGRGCQTGDCVVIDFTATADGKPFPGSLQKDFFMEIDGDGFLPGFSQHLIGQQAGSEARFSLAIPEDYENRALAGKEVSLAVTVKSIKEKILPDVDDEFARDLGSGHTGIDDLKQKLEQELAARKQAEADFALREKIFDVLIEQNPFEVPQSMVDAQVRNMIIDLQQRLSAQGVKLEDIGQPVGRLAEQYRSPAERQVRSALLLEAVALKEGLSATEEDIEKKYQEIAEQFRQDVHAIRQKVDTEVIRAQILERKALDLIRARAIIAEQQ